MLGELGVEGVEGAVGVDGVDGAVGVGVVCSGCPPGCRAKYAPEAPATTTTAPPTTAVLRLI